MRHHLPANDMQILRKRVFLGISFPLLLCHHRRRIPAWHQRGRKQAGAAYHLRTGNHGATAPSPPALHPALEPEPFCGPLPNKERKKIPYCRSGKRACDLYRKGIQKPLDQHTVQRGRKRNSHVYPAHTRFP